MAWTPDGKGVLTILWKADGTTEAVIVQVSNGSPRTLKKFDWRTPFRMTISPDGRYIAYDLPVPDSVERDIFIFTLASAEERPLIQDAGNDLYPVWTPDGKQILFVSDRGGAAGLWALPMSGGKAAGEAKLIKADMGRISPRGMTQQGVLFYEIHSADGKEREVQPQLVQFLQPRWTPAERRSWWQEEIVSLGVVFTRSIQGQVRLGPFSRSIRSNMSSDTRSQEMVKPSTSSGRTPRRKPSLSSDVQSKQARRFFTARLCR